MPSWEISCAPAYLAHRTRKVKCDGSTPGRNRCVRGGFRCDGFPAFKSPGRVALLCRKCRSSDGSSSSNASIISTPSLSWSASSVAESDEIVNTDLKLPHDRQQGGNVLEKMRLRQLRIACSACHTAKVKCRCPPHKKEYDSIASQFESRSPSQVADSGSSGLERTSYQISSKQVGNVSPSPVRSTQYALTPGHISQDLTPSTHAKTNFSMEKPWLFDKSQVLTPPRHAQDCLSGDVDMEAPPNDPSIPSYPWHDIPIMGSSMMHNTESNMAQIRETPTEDPSKERGEFIRGYHPDQEGQKVEPNVFKFDDCPPSSNEASHIQLQKDITKIPAWATSFRAEWLELAGADPISFEKGSIEPVELPAFPLYHREKATSLVSPELGSMEEYMESFKSSTPFNAYLPRYSPTESGLESFPLPPNVPKVAQSSGALVLSERSENSTGTGVLSGSSSPLPISDVFPSTNQYSYGFESTRKKVRCKYSKAESPSETINKLAQGDHSPSPSFDSFCNNLLEAATLLETKILPPAEFHVHQIPSSSVEHSSESLLEASASRDQLQISSTVLPKAKQTLTTFQIQDSGPPSSPTLDEKRAIETMPSVDGGSSSSRSNTLSSFTEDETDWGEDEVINSVQDLDFSSFSSISQEDCLSQARVKDSLTRPVFSPMKQALIDRIMKEFWIIFNQETEGIQ
jgi:hypothetical protein